MMHPRRHGRRKKGDGAEDEVAEIDPGDLSGVLATPRWLPGMGVTAWLLVGVLLLLVGAVWLLSLTHTIVMPVIAAALVASVASPLVRWLAGHRIPRGVSAALLLVSIIVLSVGVVFVIVGGITSQTSDLIAHLSDAKNTIEGWLKDLGVDPSTASDAKNDASSSASTTVSTLLHGVAGGVKELSSLVFFLALTALSLFFLLKDGPTIRSWGERHLGVPLPVAHTVTERVLQSLRGYFFGVTIVAAFNAVVVSGGALVLGIPLAGTIAAITFLGAYIPYLGAWGAGAFAVLIALGGSGTDAAVGMIVIQLLANGILQQLVQPIAYGAALGIHPLAVLVVTIGGGCLFGAVGLVLAAPITSAVTKITADLARGRAAESGDESSEAGGPPDPAVPAPNPA